MRSHPLSVLKFGSSVLRSERDLPRVVSEIYRLIRDGERVVAVVSALGRTTEVLLDSARRLNAQPPPEALASLLATGESKSAALLTVALGRAGIPCRLFSPGQLRLRHSGPLLDGEPTGLDRATLLAALRDVPVVVLPGFFGMSVDGRPGLLGRGGSDLTALFLAHELSADRCRLLKDVAGVFVSDPARAPTTPDRYRTLSFETAAKLGGVVVQKKAMRYAHRTRRSFEVATPGDGFATRVGSLPDALEHSHQRGRPLRVALLGLGTVGLGVYSHLRRWPERFECVGVAVRDPARTRECELPAGLLHESPWQVLSLDADVVVETIGGRDPAAELLRAALRQGSHVVTANKTVVAEEGARLAASAAARGVQFRFAAAVGGGVPVLEAVRRLAGQAPLRSISGVFNGTCNFVLDRMEEGASLADAVRSAQALGLAEADPGDDLRGIDAARKLAVVCHEAFGVRLQPRDIPCRGIQDLEAAAIREARAAGQTVRLIATCTRQGQRLVADVRPRRLALTHPLSHCRDEDNRILIRPERGRSTVLSGKGAGRWPTSESVLADLFDLARLDTFAPGRKPRRRTSARSFDEVCNPAS